MRVHHTSDTNCLHYNDIILFKLVVQDPETIELTSHRFISVDLVDIAILRWLLRFCKQLHMSEKYGYERYLHASNSAPNKLGRGRGRKRERDSRL